MGRRDDGPTGPAQPPDEVDQDRLASAGRARPSARRAGSTLGPEREDRGDRRALLLATREFERGAVGEVGDAHLREGLVAAARGPRPGSGPSWSGPKATSSRTVALNSWMSGSWKTRPTSRWKRNASWPAATAATSRPERLHLAIARADDPVEQLEQRRLAAAVGAEQADPLAAVDVEVDPIEGEVLARVDVADAAQPVDRLVGRAGVDGDRSPASAASGGRLGHGATAGPRRAARRRWPCWRPAGASRDRSSGTSNSVRISPVKPRASIAA